VSGSSVITSAFQVEYTPEKSGFYEINVYCGNILLNEGHSFRKEVKSGTNMFYMIYNTIWLHKVGIIVGNREAWLAMK
jgi:hypothetical protein